MSISKVCRFAARAVAFPFRAAYFLARVGVKAVLILVALGAVWTVVCVLSSNAREYTLDAGFFVHGLLSGQKKAEPDPAAVQAKPAGEAAAEQHPAAEEKPAEKPDINKLREDLRFAEDVVRIADEILGSHNPGDEIMIGGRSHTYGQVKGDRDTYSARIAAIRILIEEAEKPPAKEQF